MRRTIAGLAAFLVMTGTFVTLPVYAAPGPEAHPVEPSIEEVALGSVVEPEGDAVVTTDGEAETAEADETPAPSPSASPAPSPSPEDDPEDVATSGDELPGVPALTVSQPDTDEFSAVGITWRQGDVDDVVVQLRVKDEDDDWSDWTSLEADDIEPTLPAAAAPEDMRGGTAPYWTGESYGIEVIVQGAGGVVPEDVKVTLIDPGESPADELTAAPAATDVAHAAGMPPVYSRAQWGADESLRTWDAEYAPTLKAATIHHTADGNNYSAGEVPAIMRSTYAYHAVTRGWGDIGYNVIVDRFGRMFEGRYGGLASTVIGAHAGGFNTSTFGVSMLGNYDLVPVPQATVNAVAEIIAWKFALYGIPAQGHTVLTSAGGGTARYDAGVSVTLPTIFGHRDVGSTTCPGRYGYARLGEIRNKVASRLSAYTSGDVQQRDASTGGIIDVSPMQVSSVVADNGATTVFGRGTDGAIWYRTRNLNGGYSAWAKIPVGVASSGPSAVSPDGHRVDIAVRGAGNALYVVSGTLDPATGRPARWGAWTWLGGGLTSAPSIGSVGVGRYAVVGRGTNGGVWQRVFGGGSWSEWALLGGSTWSLPAVEADYANGSWRYLVSAVGQDRRIWQVATKTTSAGAAGAWLGGRIYAGHGPGTANASAASWTPKALSTGSSDHSVVLVDPNSSWSADLGGSLTSTAAVARQRDGSVLVFARGTDGALWTVSYDVYGGVGRWTSMGGVLA